MREFMQEFGGGRVSWLAAVHDRGEDAHNPHAHIIIRDKDHETGKRVFGTSDKGSTERIRELWEVVTNQALERAGIEARIDRRSLVDQGVDRQAGIHVGANVAAMEAKGVRPESKEQEAKMSGGRVRVIDWPMIDDGRTRADRQREIEAANDDQDRRGGKGKETGGAALMPPPSLDTVSWAEREADRRAEAARRTQELMEAARQALRPKTAAREVDGPPEDRWAPTPEFDSDHGLERVHEPEPSPASAAPTPATEPPRRETERSEEISRGGYQAEDWQKPVDLDARRAAEEAADLEADRRRREKGQGGALASRGMDQRATLPKATQRASYEAEAAIPQRAPTRGEERLAAEEAADLAADRARRDRHLRERQQQRAASPEADLARAIRELAQTDQATARRMGWTPEATFRTADAMPGWQRIAEARQAEQARQEALAAEQARQHEARWREQENAKAQLRRDLGRSHDHEGLER